MAENGTTPRRLSGFVKVVFLLCFAALIPLGVTEWYSGQNAPSETREVYDTLENILVGLILACILAWLVAEAWREIKFMRVKTQADCEKAGGVWNAATNKCFRE
jgi:hypothetical protein